MLPSILKGAACMVAGYVLLQVPAMAETPFKDAAAAIEYRQSALKALSEQSQKLAEVVRGRVPYDAAQVKADVAVFRELADKPWSAFGPGTEGGNSRPEVWQNPQAFAAAADLLKTRVTALQNAAETGDFDKVRAAFGEAASSCRACHDSFRQRR